tara:strand:+ start:32005 stop:32208 length:204 start_codon:yes stop_codon:yes gene_type:complete
LQLTNRSILWNDHHPTHLLDTALKELLTPKILNLNSCEYIALSKTEKKDKRLILNESRMPRLSATIF